MSITYVDPMLPRMSDKQLQALIAQASGLISYRRSRDAEKMADIAQRIAKARGYTLNEIKGRSRVAGLSRARHCVFHEIYATDRYSLLKIAKFFGRHHTSVLHGIRAHEARVAAERGEVAA